MTTQSTQGTLQPAVRFLHWFRDRFQPELGWITYFLVLILTLAPVWALRGAGWVNIRRAGVDPEWIVFWGVTASWAAIVRSRKTSSIIGRSLIWLLWGVWGLLSLTQVLAHWLPSLLAIVRQLLRRDPLGILVQMGLDLVNFWWRIEEWWLGVQAGGAFQDDLIFLTFAGLILWLMATATVWLTLRNHSGLTIALPPLWLLATILFYGSNERLLLVFGLGMTVALHVWIDHLRLEKRWRRSETDFSPDLIAERLLATGLIAVVVLGLALITPNVMSTRLAVRAYRALSPVYDAIERQGERFFPDLESGRGQGYGTVAGGLPNRFLIREGPDLGQVEVMRVRSNRYQDYYEEAPPRIYMRKATFSEYDGRGWRNPIFPEKVRYESGVTWRPQPLEGRSELVQQIWTSSPTTVLYAVGEPSEVRVDYEIDLRAPDDLIAIWSATGAVTRYDAVSHVLNLNEDELAAWPGWTPSRPVPEALEHHLEEPGQTSERVRALAEQFGDASTPFETATAIETYLRQIPYDLDVPAPPAGAEVADFFLFDLQRGYCDYYTTAFVVLARLNGLPTRFASGYISVNWRPDTSEWSITEAEAHSWPEVYFPDLGWVPFEPTGGRPQLERIGAPPEPSPNQPIQPLDPLPEEEQIVFNPQMLFWLLPIGALLFFVLRRWRGRDGEDPWLGLVRWGRRLGREPLQGETEIEYGEGLAHHLEEEEREAEKRRRLQQYVLSISRSVSTARYASGDLSRQAGDSARSAWLRLRAETRRFF